MKLSIQNKLEALVLRHEELVNLLGDPDVTSDQTRFVALSREYAELEPIVESFNQFQKCRLDLKEAEDYLKDPDLSIRQLAQEEYKQAKEKIEQYDQELQVLLLPKDPNDSRNIYLEIRAGTGGDEAAIFVGDLYRMYARYCEKNGWDLEAISESFGEHGGYKEIIVKVIGQGVYSKLKFESGAHRVQRVPVTESQGRIHTSACTVAILPEVESIDSIDMDPSLLRIDTYRASGAGGQHVNRTDSAVRITHLPTGTVVECQDERSQHKNKAKALALLQSRILAAEQAKQQQAEAQTRRALVGSGDRSERIRTYNFPQGRVTDHRIQLTVYQLPEIMAGELSVIIDPLIREYQADQLASLQ